MKVIIIVVLILFFYITNINIRTETLQTTTEKFSSNIDLNYKIFNILGGSRNVFIPIMGTNTLEDTTNYINIFNLDGDIEESDIYYKLIDKESNDYICVYKNSKSFKYVKNVNQEKGIMEHINEDEAIIKSNEFLSKYNFDLLYDEIVVKSYSTHFDIFYISKLDNMKNHSFLNNVRLDKKGNIIYFKYYDVSYKKLGQIEIINEQTAYQKLLSELETPYKISISSSELVYIYENSVCMPHFVFRGSNEIGEKIEIFINARK